MAGLHWKPLRRLNLQIPDRCREDSHLEAGERHSGQKEWDVQRPCGRKDLAWHIQLESGAE